MCLEQVSLPELPLIPGQGGSLLNCAPLEAPAWEGLWAHGPLSPGEVGGVSLLSPPLRCDGAQVRGPPLF